MNALAIVALIEALISTGAEAVSAWETVSAIVTEKRDPTATEWAAAGLDADAAHVAVAALK